MDDTQLVVIWFVLAAVLGAGEIMMAGTFFLAPFGVGAVAAGIAALLGAGPISFVIFIVVSLLAFLALRPLSRRMDEKDINDKGLGANRLRDSEGTVVEMIPQGPGQAGMIQIGSETWRAESENEQSIAVGTVVTVAEVMGTRLKVTPKQ